MVDMLKKIPGIGKTKNLKESFVLMKKEFEHIADDKTRYYIIKYFDIVSWLESKIRNVSFQEIIKEKQIT